MFGITANSEELSQAGGDWRFNFNIDTFNENSYPEF